MCEYISKHVATSTTTWHLTVVYGGNSIYHVGIYLYGTNYNGSCPLVDFLFQLLYILLYFHVIFSFPIRFTWFIIFLAIIVVRSIFALWLVGCYVWLINVEDR